MANFTYRGGKAIYGSDASKALKEVELFVSNTFRVDINPHRVICLDEPQGYRDAKQIFVQRHKPEEHLLQDSCENIFDKMVAEKLNCSIFTADLGYDYDYAICLSERGSISLPAIVAEEMTHGQHFCMHSADNGDYGYSIYKDRFKELSPEIIGSLGYFSTKTINTPRGDYEPLPEDLPLDTMSNKINHIAHWAIELYLQHVRDPNFRGIFSARNQVEMWDVIQKNIGDDKRLHIRSKTKELTLKDYVEYKYIFIQSQAKPLWFSLERPNKKKLVTFGYHTEGLCDMFLLEK